jgi:hypothetical protein
MLSRTVPDMPCTALLEPEEWQALYWAIQCTPTDLPLALASYYSNNLLNTPE